MQTVKMYSEHLGPYTMEIQNPWIFVRQQQQLYSMKGKNTLNRFAFFVTTVYICQLIDILFCVPFMNYLNRPLLDNIFYFQHTCQNYQNNIFLSVILLH